MELDNLGNWIGVPCDVSEVTINFLAQPYFFTLCLPVRIRKLRKAPAMVRKLRKVSVGFRKPRKVFVRVRIAE